MKTLIEIQAAEGGMDSKLLVKEMFSIYSKACINQNFKVHSVQWTEGCVNFSVEGVGALEFFEHEMVIDHSSNRTISLSKIYKGMIELLH